MRNATPEEKAALETLLRDTEHEVLLLRKRLAYLDAFLKELHTQTKGENFRVENEVVRQWFWDAYDAAITNFASFAKSLMQSGGLFGKLNNHLVQLRPGVHKELKPNPVMIHDLSGTMSDVDEQRIEREMHEYQQNHLRDEVQKRLERLFPGIKPGTQASPQQVAALKDRFAAAVKELQDERHGVAHRYEGDGERRAAANLDRLRKGFEVVEEILGDLRLVALGSSFYFDAPVQGDLDRVARDLVDQLLTGTVNEIVGEVGMNRSADEGLRHYWQFRDKKGARVPADIAPRKKSGT